jgi:hypothetical protein
MELAMRKARIAAAVVFAALLVAQLVPISRDNPPVTGDLAAPVPIAAALRTSCYDCHSNETRWPWYGRVAPISWLVAHDVREGREHLNFSQWSSYSPEKRGHLLEEIGEEVERGKMPMRIYTWMHADARLDEPGRQALLDWARSQSQALQDAAQGQR